MHSIFSMLHKDEYTSVQMKHIALTDPRYNMVGHLKFCITLTGGVVIFHDPVSLNQMTGVVLTLLGIICYTHFKVQEQKKAKNKLEKPV